MDFASALPLYWGQQPGVAGPAYLGAVVVFLFIMALFLVRGKYKWWLVLASVLALMLSWGKNFPALTNFMIDNFPLYNKFRAVSSIQVIIELCIPLLVVLGLARFFGSETEARRKQALKLGFIIALGVALLLLIIQGTFSFIGLNDGTYERYFGEEVLSMIRRDREMVYRNDTIRSAVFVLLAALVMWLYLKEKLKSTLAIVFLGILIAADLISVDRRYVNQDQFVPQRQMREPFRASAVDREILADTTIFRVYNPSEGLNGARTSNFYQSIGGYHAAKPAGMQDLFDFHVYDNNLAVLDMLNVKYVLGQDDQGEPTASYNPSVCGNAWFVSRLIPVEDANAELLGLNELEVRSEALINRSKFPGMEEFEFPIDSTATIALTNYQPNHLTYQYRASESQLVVFSEMYYANGWQAYIDGTPSDHFRVNYVLRAMEVPAGRHRIEFRFEPEIIDRGSTITLASTGALLLVLLGGIIYSLRLRNKKEEDHD